LPDRSVWDTSLVFPGSKNEIEKMFERFKIKMAADDEDDVSDCAEPEMKSTVRDGANDSVMSTARDGVNDSDFSPGHSEYSVRSTARDGVHDSVRSTARDGVNDSDFSPGHSEYSKLIGDVNKAYASSVDDVKHTSNMREMEGHDGMKTASGSKKKHKKDKKDRERKSRQSKSRSKNGVELKDGAVVSAGTQSQLATQQSLGQLATTDLPSDLPSVHASAADTGQLDLPSHLPSDLPSVHASCHSSVVVSSTQEGSTADDVGSVDGNPLDYSTAELIPSTPTREVCSPLACLLMLVLC